MTMFRVDKDILDALDRLMTSVHKVTYQHRRTNKVDNKLLWELNDRENEVREILTELRKKEKNEFS